jgi:hypothetical protein
MSMMDRADKAGKLFVSRCVHLAAQKIESGEKTRKVEQSKPDGQRRVKDARILDRNSSSPPRLPTQ